MSREKILGSQFPQDEEERTLRPQKMSDMVGQREVFERLLIAVDAASKRDDPLGHILCSGSNDHTRYDWAQCSGHPLFKAESLMLLFFCPSVSSGVEIDQEKS